MQENQNNEINSLYDKYEKEARESVHENGFKAVFGVNPNYSDKKVIQDYIHMEFLLLLQRKCTLSTDIFDSSEESEIFKKELLRINTKLNFAKALTVYYKFKIPKEDAELAKNMKKWNKDTILECY